VYEFEVQVLVEQLNILVGKPACRRHILYSLKHSFNAWPEKLCSFSIQGVKEYVMIA
jgi:hypothetical protein